ncbi:MAG: DUF799 domain-containing protein [Sideroxyarcus sp.]
MSKILNRLFLCFIPLFVTACATPQSKFDYTAFRHSQPRSILVLPPLNNSPDVHASYSFLSTVTQPLAEAGYYVFPVALVDQTFKENGLPNPGEMHQAPLGKIREIFGTDAVLYITISQYGSSYQVVSSDVVVTANANLVDARTGVLLWSGQASATDARSNNNNSGGLIGLLVLAVVKQVVNHSIGDSHSHDVARLASTRLLAAQRNGILYGPRSPNFGKDN